MDIYATLVINNIEEGVNMKRKTLCLAIALLVYVTGVSDYSTTTASAATTQTGTNKHIVTSAKTKVTPKRAKQLTSLIPAGWHILEDTDRKPIKAEGDLNKDGIKDIATIIEKNKKGDEAPPRDLLIAFGNKDKTLTLSIIAKNVVLKADEGGVWGDPFDSLVIDRGSVVLSDYGGSNWRWYNKYRFRYQNKDWYLIGLTTGTYFTGNATMENADENDYNLLTGDYIQRRTDDKGKVKVTKENRGKRKLVKLSKFDLNKF
ncbi:hypothetical protein ACFQ3W_16390 [Paenibacillus puldeungensis]|uniref:Uncharacterized protein n=1 Tax=Paenibacillus puldeungensis TaxID=696536 RepID=A0ABW3S0A5_9BACL